MYKVHPGTLDILKAGCVFVLPDPSALWALWSLWPQLALLAPPGILAPLALAQIAPPPFPGRKCAADRFIYSGVLKTVRSELSWPTPPILCRQCGPVDLSRETSSEEGAGPGLDEPMLVSSNGLIRWRTRGRDSVACR